MFDFGKLAVAPNSDLPPSLGELFGQLDRKATHTSLRPAQVSALKSLDKQIDEKDLVIKLSTGSGKTVVGLVYAEWMRRKYKGEPVLYLCPTLQLVDQVIAAGLVIGVPVGTFPDNGMPFEALRGESILACSYDRLFNAKTVFESRAIRPSTIVLDDIHAGIDRVGQCYTAQVPQECFTKIKDLLRPLCAPTDAATWRGIDQDDPGSLYEVPYWIFSLVQQQICDLLEQHRENKSLFNWENIARYSDLARFCISGAKAEISLTLPCTEENSAYSSARHRLFMSASIKDGSALIGTMDCDTKAFSRVIEPMEDEGAGERMMLPTSLISRDAKKTEIALACAVLSKQTNVVVLTSSEAQAAVWQGAGATYCKGVAVDDAINKLRRSNHNYFVFAQRFDGVDLADDACRVLVIDGVPHGDRLCDQVDYYRQKDSPEFEVRTVNKFEQALGRAVRSSADYAAVFLVGPDIASFIGKKSVYELLEGRSRVQVDLGKELAAQIGADKPIAQVLNEMTGALLSRNEGWKDAHRMRVKAVAKSTRDPETLTVFEVVAATVRDAWGSAKGKNFQGAVATLREISNDTRLHKIQRAELLYKIGNYLHQFDPSAAAEAYRSVFSMNIHFPRPDKVADRKFSRVTDQAVAVRDYFSDFNSPNAAIARIDEIKAKLAFGNAAETVEQGLFELGTALGASSSRPEKETKRGPDVLWQFDENALCIEAKSEKEADIFKSDAAQLSLSLQWCRDSLDLEPGLIRPVFATNVVTVDRSEDVSFGPSILNEDNLMGIVERLRQLLLALSFDGPLFTNAPAVGKKLSELGLSGKQIAASLPILKS